ncbi:YgiQ family radical SAM protein [candidate division FCPU426 bacterium]|nr:YgiQ family radical SAM protein [candidate division FCPU426 bacterium]
MRAGLSFPARECYNQLMQQPDFLPMSRSQMQTLGWEELDILLVSGDAFVDHPSFGTALIGRFLVHQGFRVGVVAQPDWKKPSSVTVLGRPRLFAGVTAGAMDSMVSNYTANRKLRRNDAYAPGGRYGLRPNRATLVYANLVKQAFPGLPVVLGGIEASLRRMVHYDYWEDKIRRSLLLDAKADILVYGMGEKPVLEIAKRLSRHASLDNIAQTVIVRSQVEIGRAVTLPSYEDILKDKNLLARAALIAESTHSAGASPAVPLLQPHGNRIAVIYPPAAPLTTAEMDALYALPFSRRAHPGYAEKIPALESVAASLVTHRGCFGGCSFCALGAHQGKIIQSRSQAAITREVRLLAQSASFRGTITDLGGPSANMYAMACLRPQGPCRRPSCLFPDICRHLQTSHRPQIALLQAVQKISGVKHALIASGIRCDLALQDPAYIRFLSAGKHISGALKIAPEHTQPQILKSMRKPGIHICEQFILAYKKQAQQLGQPGYLTAYFIASFPGSSAQDMQAARRFAKKYGLRVEQMQDFIPLPMTLAGIMYHTGRDPKTGKPLVVEKSHSARKQQRRVLLGQKNPR